MKYFILDKLVWLHIYLFKKNSYFTLVLIIVICNLSLASNFFHVFIILMALVFSACFLLIFPNELVKMTLLFDQCSFTVVVLFPS